MRILHYFLGFNRSGGLNRYATDLAITQKESGEQVFVLFPGGSLLPWKLPVIIRRKNHAGISCYEILGGNPIPLLSGIHSPQMILEQKHQLSQEVLDSFCKEVQPDIFHSHTWMGFPEELIPCLHKQGCKIIYTTHDYFGICPKVNLIKPDGSLCLMPCNEECSKCNATAPSERYLQLRNINFLFKIKKCLAPLCKFLPISAPSTTLDENKVLIQDYNCLQEHYHDLLKLCDRIHFNSEVTKRIFMHFFPDLNGIVVPITHRGIKNKQKSKQLNQACIQLFFIGSLAPYKGFPLLKSVLASLKNEGLDNWKLNVWGNEANGVDPDIPEIIYHGRFDANDEEHVLHDADLLIVPSIWFETFGFIVAEALSFGVPVLCSDTVGAQTIVGAEMVFSGKSGMKDKLASFLRDGSALSSVRMGIVSGKKMIQTEIDHWKIINEKLYGPG
jgi:glycosyltransferase involved in cell wall biosynthesis